MTVVTLYEVGGCVRDELLGIPTKDIDFTAVVSEAYGRDPFEELKMWLTWNDFEVFTTKEAFFTIRAHFPRGMTHWGVRNVERLTADFVLARREGEYTDGRRPDRVEAGTLEDDLRRRDFTVNAMAKNSRGQLIDLFGGQEDLKARLLRTVGTPEERFGEDALRALRALRFAITKDMAFDEAVSDALRSEWLPPLLSKVAVERRREELLRAFKHDTLATLDLLQLMTPDFREAVFSDGLRLEPTLKD